MIPKINARGSSFKGLAAYLLHDKDAATSGRVAWVETINLATRNPQTAWRVMAATAMNAASLKEQAGVKRSGRTSKDAVLHISLSWPAGREPERKDMTAFAGRALAALKAEDRQAMVICHDDTDHPHLHLIVNRVSPTDGRMLSSSNEKRALSELALVYEKEQGQIDCPQRAENAERREKGEYVRGEKDVPREEYEPMRDAQQEAEKSVSPVLLEQHPQLVAKMRADFRQRWRDQARKTATQLKTKWRELYDGQRGRAGELAAERNTARAGLAERVGGGPDRPSAQFAKEKLGALAVLKDRARNLFERERASVARESRKLKQEGGQAIRAIYEAGLKQLALFRPMPFSKAGAAGADPIPQQNTPTDAQRRLTELARRFTQQSSGQAGTSPGRTNQKQQELVKEREWEPEP